MKLSTRLQGRTVKAANRTAWRLLAGVVAAVAVTARLHPVLRGGGLSGLGNYDDAVYFGASLAWVNGELPYRDFLLLHPPGIVLALAPFAILGRLIHEGVGFATARLAWMLMGAVSAVLVMRILRPAGLAAAAVGGMTYALYFPAVYTELTTQLQGVQNFCVLLGLLALHRATTSVDRVPSAPAGRLLVLAGFSMGIGATVKIWGVLTILLVAGYLLLTRRLRAAVLVAGGSAAAVTAVCLPFFWAAPRAMWRQVVVAQLGRSGDSSSARERLHDLAGLRLHALQPSDLLLLSVGLLVLVAAAMALSSPSGRLPVVMLLGLTALLLASPSWYRHYAALIAPPLALVVGSAVGAAVARLRTSATAAVRPLALALSAAVLTGVVAIAAPLSSFRFGHPFPTAGLAPVVASRSGCVTADSATALIELDVLSRNIHRGCRTVVDLGGYTYVMHAGAARWPERAQDSRWQREALRYLRSGRTSVVVMYRQDVHFSRRTASTIAHWRVLARAGDFELRRPRAPQTSPRG